MQIKIIVHTVVTNENKILFLKRADSVSNLPGYWDIPGGSLEKGEDPKLGAIRETLEETSLQINNPKLFFSFSNADESKNMQFITMIYRSNSLDETLSLSPDEHQEYKWVNFSEAINFIRSNKTPDYLESAIEELLAQ